MDVFVVKDEEIPCPGCGAYWGHPDPKLDFKNRFKVDDWARCYNPECDVEMYQPSTGEVERRQP